MFALIKTKFNKRRNYIKSHTVKSNKITVNLTNPWIWQIKRRFFQWKAKGLSLGPSLANAFLLYFETSCFQNCPSDFKLDYYLCYVVDIFVLLISLSLFYSPHQNNFKIFKAFQNFLNGRQANMSFTIKNEKQSRISFLNVQIICEYKKFTSSNRKLTFSGVYTYFQNF